MDNEKTLRTIELEDVFRARLATAVLSGTNDQVNRYAAATRRARRLWLAPTRPLPLP